MIEAENLTKNYGPIEAVRGVSFSAGAAEVIGLLGPNGAGKTTTMRMLTTFLAPTSGSATIAGYDLCRDAHEVRKNIGYLPETPPLYPELRVSEYLSFVAKIKGVPKRSVPARIDEAMGRCSLSDVRARLCGQLSKGYRQRVGLAAALVHKPKVIILDEPTSGLDPAQIIEIRRLIRELGSEHTVVLSTHILPEVEEVCSKVIIISEGSIVAKGSIAELTAEATLEERFLEAVAGARRESAEHGRATPASAKSRPAKTEAR